MPDALTDQQPAPRFIWPPRPEPATPPAPDSPPRAPTPTPPRWRTHLREIEQAFLDITTPPLTERLARDNFKPDALDTFCHRCARTRAKHGAHADDGCDSCRNVKLPWARAVRLGEYRHPLRTIIREIKFHSWRRLGRDAGALLGAQIAHAINRDLAIRALSEPDLARIIVTPVPTSLLRRLTRGLDHTHVIAHAAARALRYELATTGNSSFTVRFQRLLRRRHGLSQTQVRPSERARNVSRKIELSRAGRRQMTTTPGPTLIIVLDDVRTTGATLRACCLVLQKEASKRRRKAGNSAGAAPPESGEQNPAKIWVATIAAAEPEQDDQSIV